ncbi:hypothetical protein DB30_02673 [Enhygromyxa salina]|uniref:Uncharacterized protein n=1 Tax=Enhygromyxa salina TaxID=215803 RepID=A0A0C2DI96_9BACT|nr:hypothetical protein [Enhygromyxa salina]KIG19392.1 hypothetical protein DB30_02673 [Enhygromyxa salina]
MKRFTVCRCVSFLVCVSALACDAPNIFERAPRPAPAEDVSAATSPTIERVPAFDEIDPCTELGVIIPRQSIELAAPRAGIVRGGGPQLIATGALLYEIEAGDDVAVLEVQRAELDEAKATRERYAAEQHARARELRGAEQLGAYLPDTERDTAREAHTIAAREVHRADALRRAASARLEAQRARIEAGQLEAPFAGRLIREWAVPGAWVEAGQPLARFASTEDLVIRVALPAEHGSGAPIEARWRWPDGVDEPLTVHLHPTGADVDELSGLRIYEAPVNAADLRDHALGGRVNVELPTCHGHAIPQPPRGTEHEP